MTKFASAPRVEATTGRRGPLREKYGDLKNKLTSDDSTDHSADDTQRRP